MVPKMSQSATQIEPLVPRDTYPVMRVAVEYFLRAVDILPEVHHDMVTSVVFVTLWYGQVQGRGRSPVSIRELSRKMGLPYETVRRHARALVRGGQCIEQKGGLAVAPAMMRSSQTAAMLRRSYVNAVRMLRHLTRIEVARFNVGPDRRLRSGRLTREQTTIGMAGIGLLLTGLRTLHAFVGDLDERAGLHRDLDGQRQARDEHSSRGRPRHPEGQPAPARERPCHIERASPAV